MKQGLEKQLKVLVAGGGVAGLEALLALRELAAGAVAPTLLAADPEFVYRPMTVREPFALSRANHHSLAEIADDLGVELIQDRLERVDPARRTVHTAEGAELPYDALVMAVGTRLAARFQHAITIDDRQIDEQLHGLIQDVEGGYIERLAFIAPAPMPWPLPLYELALMTARRADDMDIQMSITLVTPEEGPLAAFGTSVCEQMERLLARNGILVIPSAHCEVPEVGRVEIRPSDRLLHVDRIVALPQLLGPTVEGMPVTQPDGFIPVDDYCQVRGLERVWAVGDATEFPVKMGGIAAQQADVAATEIARLAGSGVERQRFEPEVHAILLGAEKPLYLSAQLTGGHGMSSELSETPAWAPAKIVAKYLTPYLESRDRSAERVG